MRSKSDFPKLKEKAVLSPMAGVTDVAFRTLCKSYGCAMTYTEFVSSTAIVRGNESTKQMIVTDPSEKPVAVQLFGASVKDVVLAAQKVEDQFDVIDVNCGCPAWKVIKTGAGSELLKKPEGIANFINKLASGVSKPVTIKIRTGIDDKHINAIEVAKVAEDAGAAAIAIHGRTQKQAYKGVANWDIIKKVKETVNIPVIGNGDVFSPETFKERIEETNVDAIMIARGALGKPFIFKQINDYLKKGKYDEGNQVEDYLKFLKLAEQYSIQFSHVKEHAMYFTKGMEGGAEIRRNISTVKNIPQVQEIMEKLK